MAAEWVVYDGSGEVGLHGRFHIHNVRQNRLETGLHQFLIRRIAHAPAQHHLAIFHHRQLLVKTMLALMMAAAMIMVVVVMIMVMAAAAVFRHIPQFLPNDPTIFNFNHSTLPGPAEMGANCLTIIGNYGYFHIHLSICCNNSQYIAIVTRLKLFSK